jgi:hypothetical protein
MSPSTLDTPDLVLLVVAAVVASLLALVASREFADRGPREHS